MDEAIPSTTHNGVTPVAVVLGCRYCESPKNVMTQLVDESSSLLRAVRCIAELLEELCDVVETAVLLPCGAQGTPRAHRPS